MKTLFLIFAMFLNIYVVVGQDCEDKLALNEIDMVTKHKKVTSAYMSFKVNFKENYTISFNLDKGILTFISSSTSPKLNKEGSSLVFMFDNGIKIVIDFENPSIVKDINNKTIYFNSVNIKFDSLELFATHNIVSVFSNGQDETFEIKNKKAEVIKEFTNCFFLQIERDDVNDVNNEMNIKTSQVPDYYKPCDVTEDKIDEFEGYRKRALHYAGIAKPTESGFPLFINLKSIDNRLYMSAELDAISYCISDNSKILIKLEDNKIVRLSHLGGVRCGKRAMFEILFSENDKEVLRNSPIKLIRLETEDGNIDLSFILIKNYFVDNIDCI